MSAKRPISRLIPSLKLREPSGTWNWLPRLMAFGRVDTNWSKQPVLLSKINARNPFVYEYTRNAGEQMTDSDEINDLLDKLQAVARGFPVSTVAVAAAMLLVNTTVARAPSVEKACSALRIAGKTMQDDARERWDTIKSSYLGRGE
jgi:hypothetical protein